MYFFSQYVEPILFVCGILIGCIVYDCCYHLHHERKQSNKMQPRKVQDAEEVYEKIYNENNKI
jgi:hypothetical protein